MRFRASVTQIVRCGRLTVLIVDDIIATGGDRVARRQVFPVY